uniref:Histone domain-containing protein n=1 Tax=Macrostomum lignano TaxID=282301 RepID=A0A1I8F8N5_9PLAT
MDRAMQEQRHKQHQQQRRSQTQALLRKPRQKTYLIALQHRTAAPARRRKSQPPLSPQSPAARTLGRNSVRPFCVRISSASRKTFDNFVQAAGGHAGPFFGAKGQANGTKYKVRKTRLWAAAPSQRPPRQSNAVVRGVPGRPGRPDAAKPPAETIRGPTPRRKKLLKQCGEKLVRAMPNFVYELVSTEINHLPQHPGDCRLYSESPFAVCRPAPPSRPPRSKRCSLSCDLLERLHSGLLADLRRCEPPAVLTQSDSCASRRL